MADIELHPDGDSLTETASLEPVRILMDIVNNICMVLRYFYVTDILFERGMFLSALMFSLSASPTYPALCIEGLFKRNQMLLGHILTLSAPTLRREEKGGVIMGVCILSAWNSIWEFIKGNSSLKSFSFYFLLSSYTQLPLQHTDFSLAFMRLIGHLQKAHGLMTLSTLFGSLK